MFAAFVVVLGLTGAPLASGESHERFATIEECTAFTVAANRKVIANLDASQAGWSEVRSQCLPDIGQTPADVFALPIEPSPDTTAPK